MKFWQQSTRKRGFINPNKDRFSKTVSISTSKIETTMLKITKNGSPQICRTLILRCILIMAHAIARAINYWTAMADAIITTFWLIMASLWGKTCITPWKSRCRSNTKKRAKRHRPMLNSSGSRKIGYQRVCLPIYALILSSYTRRSLDRKRTTSSRICWFPVP